MKNLLSKVFAYLIVCMMVMSFAPASYAAGNAETEKSVDFEKGLGTRDDPLQIESVDQLKAVKKELGMHYILMKDLDLNNANFPVIGSKDAPFTGTFDGNGHTISNLKVGSMSSYAGLFAKNKGIIKNLGLSNANLRLRTGTKVKAGAVAGINEGTIDRCYATATIDTETAAESNYVGGIAGENTGTITNVYSLGKSHASGGTDCTAAGGIAGYNNGGKIKSVYSVMLSEAAGASDTYQGAITGRDKNGVTEACFSIGSVSKQNKESAAKLLSVSSMLKQESYKGMDFKSTWTMEGNNNYPLPEIQKLPMRYKSNQVAKIALKGEKLPGSKMETSISGIKRSDYQIAYEWKADGNVLGMSSSYTIDADDARKQVALTAIGLGCESGWILTDRFQVKPQDTNAASAPSVKADTKAAPKLTTKKTKAIPEGYTGIYTKEDLNNVRTELSGKYILMNDITFTESDFQKGGSYYNEGSGWQPIGVNGTKFSGIFNGNGYAIRGLQINQISTSFQDTGLFAYNGGTIENLGMVDYTIKIKSGKGANIGGIAGLNGGEISNCYNTGNLSISLEAGISTMTQAGGIAGENNAAGKITNCYNTGSVDASDYAGGITASNRGTITGCYNTGMTNAIGYSTSVVENSVQEGGITGKNSGSITDCYSIKSLENGNETQTGVTYLSEQQLRTSDAMKAYDFQNVWVIDGQSEYPYPQLRTIAHRVEADNNREFYSGKGTSYAPYVIKTKEHLDHVRNYLGAYYSLDTDLVFSEKDFSAGGDYYNKSSGWQPIGVVCDESFYGQFNGDGHTISGIRIKITEQGELPNVFAGLFGYNRGIIKNLGMKDSNISIAGISKQYTYAGGIAGDNGGLINGCYSMGAVKSPANAGGIAGYNYGTITDSYNAGSIAVDSDYAGGIAGRLLGGAITNCHNTGTIAASTYAGGIIGESSGSPVISGCYNTGDINTYSYAGGIAGQLSDGTVTKSSNTGNVVADNSCAGGIVGRIYGKINDSYNTGSVCATLNYAGGIAGSGNGSAAIKNCYNIGNIGLLPVKTAYAGSIVGYGASTEQCYSVQWGDNTKTAGVSYLSEKQLRNTQSFDGYDFQADWIIDSDSEYPYPQLRALKYVNVKENTVDFNGGKGTLYAPYQIKTKEHLNNVRKFPGAYYTLDTDINFSASDFQSDGAYYNEGHGWLPIGNGAENQFWGYFDGMGHTITGIQMKLEAESNTNAGLFSNNSGIIKHLGIAKNDMSAISEDNAIIGAIAGRNGGVIMGCYHSGKLSADKEAGGIAGKNDGIINDCYNIGEVSADDTFPYVGGIAAYNSGSIRTSYNTGPVQDNIARPGGYIGGITGENYGKITESYYLQKSNYNSREGKSLTEEQMKEPENFVGFDFDHVWVLDKGAESSSLYPQLKNVKLIINEISFSLEPSIRLELGESKELHVNCSDSSLLKSVIWKSSNEKIVTVDKNGIVKGVAFGKAEITAKAAYGNKSAVCAVTVAKPISDCIVSLVKEWEYNGKEIDPNLQIKDGEKLLKKGVDFEVSYSDNVNAGTVVATIKGMGDYCKTIEKTFVIHPKSMETCKVSGIEDTDYTGDEITQKIVVKDGEKKLEPKTDYTVSYENNVELGTATVIAEGKGNYTGSITKQFKITKSIKYATVSGIENRQYTGLAQKQKLIVKDNGKILKEGIDYSVAYDHSMNVGTATVIIKGMNYYTGEITRTFLITVPNTLAPKFSSSRTTSARITWKTAPHVTGYQIAVGTKVVKTINGGAVSSATVTGLAPGKGYSLKMRAYVKDSTGIHYGRFSDRLLLPTDPAKTSVYSLKTKKRSITVKWKRTTGTGYQVMRAANSKFSKSKKTYKVSSYKSTSKKMTSLRKGRTYYVKVRAYKTYGGKTVYGSWSKAKKIRCK